MAKKDDFKKQDENLENVNEALSSTSEWIEANSKLITISIAAITVVVIGIMLINNYVIRPNRLEASNEIAKAAVYFSESNWQKALEGDDADCIGFAAIADEYSSYQQGRLAALYAGICYYKQGQYDEAADYLKRFKAKDAIVYPAAAQLLGDAYVQGDELKKAVSAFETAAKSGNELIAPMSLKKLGFVQMELGDNAAANKAFQAIKKNYPASQEAQDIDKYIELTK